MLTYRQIGEEKNLNIIYFFLSDRFLYRLFHTVVNVEIYLCLGYRLIFKKQIYLSIFYYKFFQKIFAAVSQGHSIAFNPYLAMKYFHFFDPVTRQSATLRPSTCNVSKIEELCVLVLDSLFLPYYKARNMNLQKKYKLCIFKKKEDTGTVL